MMRSRLVWIATLLFCLASGVLPVGAQSPWQERPEHVVLVSVDGLRPEFYLEPHWPAPTMQQMAQEGAHAEAVRGVFPTVTYPSHTTLVTGALPQRHGVFYNRPFEPEGQTGRWYWEEARIQVPTLWDAVRAKGMESAAISWPVTVGAPIDRVVPEVWALDPRTPRLQPMEKATAPPGLWQELEREATGALTLRTFSADYMSRDDQTGAAAAYLLETKKPALLALHLIASDHFQHESGRTSLKARRAVGAADRAISAVVEAAERAGILEATAFIVTGDHGFVDVHTRLAPNVWLVEAGLMEESPDRGDWRATFHPSGGSAFLHLRNPEDEAVVQQVRGLLAKLPRRLQKLFRVVERPELDAIGADPAAPLALAATPGVVFSGQGGGPVLTPARGGQHGYFPDFPQIHTGFVGWGAGFRPGAVAQRLGLEDIAPMIAELLDLDLEAPDGTCPWGLLTERGRGR